MSPPPFTAQRPLGMLVKIFPKLSETFILEEILGLERLGVPIRLYALMAPTDAITHPAVDRVRAPLKVVPEWARGRRREIVARHLRMLAAAPLRYLEAFMQAFMGGPGAFREFVQAGWLAMQLRDDGVEHLHVHFISKPADVAAIAATLTALPFSISAHAKDIYLSHPSDLRRKLEAARFTVTCTEFNRVALAAIAPNARVHRMYHGIDGEQFHPDRRVSPDTPPRILSVGRLRPKKGLDTLIDACQILRDSGTIFRCEIIGYGDEKDRLQAQIARLGLTDYVRLIGKLPRDQVIEAYARSTVYVQPSRIAADGDRDGIPNVLLEAMAMGLPVVASAVSGIPELVVNGRNGLLVAPDDAQALARTISRVLHEPALCASLGGRARETVTQLFNNDRNLQLLCGLLQAHDAEDVVHEPGHDAMARPAPRQAPMAVK